MRFARAAARVAAIAVTTAFLYSLFLLRRRARNTLVRAWSRAVSRILGIRVTADGPRPAGQFFLVANHLGYLDILVLGQLIDVVFVAKLDMRGWPVIGPLASSTGTIWVDRDSRRDTMRVTGEMTRVAASGLGVVLFPEGTSSDGSQVLPFKSSLLEAPARSGLPVHHAAIRYDPPEVAWWDDTTFGAHFWSVLQLPRIDAWVRFGGSITSSDRKELARRLWEEVDHGVRQS